MRKVLVLVAAAVLLSGCGYFSSPPPTGGTPGGQTPPSASQTQGAQGSAGPQGPQGAQGPQGSVPTGTPRTGSGRGGATTNGCVDLTTVKARLTAVQATQGPGPMINELNTLFDQAGGTVGEQWSVGPFDLTNPGPGGASLIWTDALHMLFQIITAGQTLEQNLFRVRTQGDWGVYITFTSTRIPTPGRSARVCDKVDLDRDFPFRVR